MLVPKGLKLIHKNYTITNSVSNKKGAIARRGTTQILLHILTAYHNADLSKNPYLNRPPCNQDSVNMVWKTLPFNLSFQIL